MPAARQPLWTLPEVVRAEPFVRSRDVTRVFRIFLRCLLAGGIASGVIAYLARDWKAVIGAVVACVVTPALLVALRHGKPHLAMTGAVSMLLLIACGEVAFGNGIHDIGICIFAVTTLISALLLDRRSAVMFSALSVLCVAMIGTAELTGYLVTPLSYKVALNELSILVCLLGTFAVMIRAVARALYAGLEAAALNEQTYREIFNAASDGILILDAHSGSVLDVNDSACLVSGFSREELLAGAMRDAGSASGGQSASTTLAELVPQARQGQQITFEWQAARKDGSAVWLEVALRAAQIRGQQRVLAAVRDISDRKAAAEQLRVAERLNAVGQLAGGVAHDFNNQLTGIVTSAGFLKNKLRADATAQACLDTIVHCSNRAADLTRQLLAFARKGNRREEVVDVEGLVREVVSLLERSIDKRVELSVQLLGNQRCRVLGDASFLSSALLNLGLNARDAMPHGGSLRFETSYVPASELQEAARAKLPKAAIGHYVRVRVSDTGIGIAPDALDRLFEPFFTTKPQGHGLGLSAAYGTVHAHGGSISVTSSLGEGTSFELLLPATDRALNPPHERQKGAPLPRLRILLAEDERTVGQATELLLRELGCSVVWCRDGRAALDAFERDADAFDLAILDHSMPHLLGSQVAQRIAVLRPQLPIIATSGFAEGLVEDGARSRRIFLPKPFNADQLQAALEQIHAR
jgi:PAS domain S-box-containing protein